MTPRQTAIAAVLWRAAAGGAGAYKFTPVKPHEALRKTRLRYQTPDNHYAAFGDARDIAGMDHLVKLPNAATKQR